MEHMHRRRSIAAGTAALAVLVACSPVTESPSFPTASATVAAGQSSAGDPASRTGAPRADSSSLDASPPPVTASVVTGLPSNGLDLGTTSSAEVVGRPSDCPGVRCVSVVVTGDVLLHPPLWDQAARDGVAEGHREPDFAPLLSAQRPYLVDADLAICHLETPIAAPGESPEGFPLFAVPPQIVPALAATGYDACSTASNHTEDQSNAGVDATLDALDAAGIAHNGSYRTAAAAAQPTLLNTPGGTVALIAATYGLNTDAPPDPSWRVDIIDVPTILARAAAARAAGADLVVVALHSGTEYDHDPTRTQQSVATELLESPAVDFVYGHHAHVVQPLEQINDKWVAYGLGNTVAAHGISDLANREGLLVRVQFSSAADGTWSTSDISWQPSLVDDHTPYRWCPLTLDSQCSADDITSLDRIEAFVNGRGAAADGAHRMSAP